MFHAQNEYIPAYDNLRFFLKIWKITLLTCPKRIAIRRNRDKNSHHFLTFLFEPVIKIKKETHSYKLAVTCYIC